MNKYWLLKRGIAKQRKEGSFRERKIFVRKEHFIIIAIDIFKTAFNCFFTHVVIKQYQVKCVKFEKKKKKKVVWCKKRNL